MHMFRTLGSNTWALTLDGVAYRVWRRRGEDANGAPKGWVWTVQAWRTRSGRVTPGYWAKLPTYGPKASVVVATVEQMLAEVRPEG
jgi:hypothetical protein